MFYDPIPEPLSHLAKARGCGPWTGRLDHSERPESMALAKIGIPLKDLKSGKIGQKWKTQPQNHEVDKIYDATVPIGFLRCLWGAVLLKTTQMLHPTPRTAATRRRAKPTKRQFGRKLREMAMFAGEATGWMVQLHCMQYMDIPMVFSTSSEDQIFDAGHRTLRVPIPNHQQWAWVNALCSPYFLFFPDRSGFHDNDDTCIYLDRYCR